MSPERLAVLFLVGSLVACQANDDAFYDDVFKCSASAATNSCGTTRSGQPMVCYPGSQLGGGSDFCTETCDPDAGFEPGYVCLTSGARLKSCTPDPPDGGASECPSGLNCFRTDLVADEGVCLMMPVCATDGDCRGSQLTKCTASVIHDLFPSITTDHLYCAQVTCGSSGATCGMNESCLANFFDLASTEPDLCVPNCIGLSGDCPPDFACAHNPLAGGAPSICLPGVPGQRCDHDQDCLLGNCVNTGAGFSECLLLPCDQTDPMKHGDNDCAPLDVDQTFACANGICVGLTAYHGASCITKGDCLEGQDCFFYGPFGEDETRGECRVPCDLDLTCRKRGGVPQVCLADGAGGCYPGDFGMPCTASDQCLSSLQCLPAAPDPRTIITSPSICTRTCATDDDCRSSPVIRNHGFCGDDGVCRLAGRQGVVCTRNEQCSSIKCLTDPTTGVQTCGP